MQLDTVIVGGGLCGLALADGLHKNGLSFALFEARDRLGDVFSPKRTTFPG